MSVGAELYPATNHPALGNNMSYLASSTLGSQSTQSLGSSQAGGSWLSVPDPASPTQVGPQYLLAALSGVPSASWAPKVTLAGPVGGGGEPASLHSSLPQPATFLPPPSKMGEAPPGKD